MSAKIIDGKELAANIRETLKERVDALKQKGIVPGLSVILVGNDPSSEIYVRNKEKTAQALGLDSRVYRLDESAKEQELLDLVDKLNNDDSVHGFLVQLPLPAHMDADKVIQSIRPEKDVDGFSMLSAGALMTGQNRGFVACTPKGVISMIEKTGVEIKGANAVVVGRSNIVGKPVAMLLLERHATVTICHSRTRDLGAVCRGADILVVAIGRPGMITGDMVKPGAVVIDVGTTRVDGKLRGDVAFDEAKETAGYISPVPGGVGPMTITMLIENTIKAAERHG